MVNYSEIECEISIGIGTCVRHVLCTGTLLTYRDSILNNIIICMGSRFLRFVVLYSIFSVGYIIYRMLYRNNKRRMKTNDLNHAEVKSE